MAELRLAPGVLIPESELEFQFVRSSGPGGQNVNKVNTKAVLRWNLIESRGLSESARTLLLARLGPRLTRAGELILTSDRYRDQPRNREDCLEKLGACLRAALVQIKPRRETERTRGSERRRRVAKARAGEIKALRRKPTREE